MTDEGSMDNLLTFTILEAPGSAYAFNLLEFVVGATDCQS